jgi:GTP diphosphokinase / guanosine-3',5'-bis(diphosphate) 3'-diphosphatase
MATMTHPVPAGSSPADHLRHLMVADHPGLGVLFDALYEVLRSSGTTVADEMVHMALTAMHDTGVGAPAALAVMGKGLPDEDIPLEMRNRKEIMEILRGIRALLNLNTIRANVQSENFMRFLLLLSQDLQALLAVKSIKLYHLRHTDGLTDIEVEKLVSDLEHLYLPLAHRLGLYHIKSEMEDFVMQRRHHEIYRLITRALHDTEGERQAYIERFLGPVRKVLAEAGIPCTIRYRVKTIASIWRKMQMQRVGVDGVFDVFAIRIIFEGSEDEGKRRCWEIYSLITDLYRPDVIRLRDWISVPRPSGYESLHTTVEGPGGKPVEVQIRTLRMDREAEEGPAAHWRYKDGGRKGSDVWLARARGLLGHTPTATKGEDSGNKVPEEIFTITPAGHLIRMKEGATILDFAFEVHTEVGLRCKGARVNGRIAPIRQQLNNGDTVEILTAAHPNVGEDWLKIVVSSKARNRIRKALQERDEKDVVAGRELLERKLRQWKAGTLDDHVTRLLNHFRLKDVAIMYHHLGTGKITATQIRKAMQEDPETRAGKPKGEPSRGAPPLPRADEGVLVINEELETTAWQLAQCCLPMSGDPVFGFVTVGKGMKVHRNNCPNAAEMKGRYPYRIIPVRWAAKGESGLNIQVEVSGLDKLGIVNAITDIIAGDAKVMMRSINFRSGAGRFRGEMRLWVSDREHLGWVLRKIQQVDGVERAVVAAP